MKSPLLSPRPFSYRTVCSHVGISVKFQVRSLVRSHWDKREIKKRRQSNCFLSEISRLSQRGIDEKLIRSLHGLTILKIKLRLLLLYLMIAKIRWFKVYRAFYLAQRLLHAFSKAFRIFFKYFLTLIRRSFFKRKRNTNKKDR